MNYTQTQHVDSYYAATANLILDCPTLTEEIAVDTCIIGGGITGVSTLLELTEKGQQAILLEGSKIAFGASGRNGGQVIAGYACGMGVFIEQFGIDQAQFFWDVGIEAVDIVKERISKHHIQCDWQDGYATLAIKERQLNDLQHLQDEAKLFGAHVFELWDKATTEKHIASTHYIGALYDANSGHLHPMNYCLGLAKAALNMGAVIYEQSPVIKVQMIDGMAHIDTKEGKVIAKNLVLAANVYIENLQDTLLKPLQRRIMPIATQVTATEKLDANVANALISPRLAVCDSNHLLNYYRLSADNRLLFGGEVSYRGDDSVLMGEAIKKKIVAYFPQLSNVKLDYTWKGYVDATANRAPDWGRLAPNIYYAQGFSGHGVALTNLAGRIIAEAISGNDARLKRFEAIKHQNIPLNKTLRSVAQKIALTYYSVKDDL